MMSASQYKPVAMILQIQHINTLSLNRFLKQIKIPSQFS
jgi:hypothetical protein